MLKMFMQEKGYRKQRYAFTMVEILLVVVVVAIIGVVGVKFLANQAREAKIQVVIKDMKQYLQSGLNYYQVHGSWPAPDATRSTDASLGGYSPLSSGLSGLNPWFRQYNTSVAKANQGEFQVWTLVPDQIIADRIVAALPSANSQPTSGGIFVNAYVGAAFPFITPPLTLVKIDHGYSSALGAWPAPDNGGGGVGGNLALIKSQDEYKEIDGSPDYNTQLNNKRQAAMANPIQIPKPTCPVGSTGKYQLYLSGYQKSCYMKSSSAGNQCDPSCPTSGEYCNQAIDVYDIADFTHSLISLTFTPNSSQPCCKHGGYVTVFASLVCKDKVDYQQWSCNTVDALDDILDAIPIWGTALDQDGTKSPTGFERAVSIDVLAEDAANWNILVRTSMVRPAGLIDSRASLEGSTDATASYDNFSGAVNYITYCQPNPPIAAPS